MVGLLIGMCVAVAGVLVGRAVWMNRTRRRGTEEGWSVAEERGQEGSRLNGWAEYEQGVADGRRGVCQEHRLEDYAASAAKYVEEKRQQLASRIASAKREEEDGRDRLRALEAEVSTGPSREHSVLASVALSVMLIAGWLTETVMTYAVAEVWFTPHPLLLWVAAAFIAGVPAFAGKFALADPGSHGKRWTQLAFATLALTVPMFLSYHRATALALEAKSEGGFVAEFVGGQFWPTFFTLLILNLGVVLLAAFWLENMAQARRASRVRKQREAASRTYRTLAAKVAHSEALLAGLEHAAQAALRVSTARYELGFAHGTAQRVREAEEPGTVPSKLRRVVATVAGLATVLAIAVFSAGCGGGSLFEKRPQNIVAVVLDPHGATPVPKALARDIAQDIVSRAPRCSRLLFLTPNSHQNYDTAYRLTIPCAASRQRRDADLVAVYQQFDREFNAVLDRWWAIPRSDVQDWTGTLRRISDELQAAPGKRTVAFVAQMWWVDPKSGPPALGPLPELNFSKSRVFLGFTHGYSPAYDLVDEPSGRVTGTLSTNSYERFMKNWSEQFIRWGVEPGKLTTAAFGPQHVRDWISSLGDEASEYRKWRTAHPRNQNPPAKLTPLRLHGRATVGPPRAPERGAEVAR